jgi:hypothetical protein
MPPIDQKTIDESAAIIKQAIAIRSAELAVAQTKIDSLKDQIAKLRQATIPPSDVLQFLKDYIDAKAVEYLPVLNYEIASLVNPTRGVVTLLAGGGEPLSFDEYESLLTPDGESLLGPSYWEHGVFSNGPITKYKTLRLLTNDNAFGWGRAFCFFFGDQMKHALEVNADKIVIPPIVASKMHESSRAQRRVLLNDLQQQLTQAQDEAATIRDQLHQMGARLDLAGEWSVKVS